MRLYVITEREKNEENFAVFFSFDFDRWWYVPVRDKFLYNNSSTHGTVWPMLLLWLLLSIPSHSHTKASMWMTNDVRYTNKSYRAAHHCIKRTTNKNYNNMVQFKFRQCLIKLRRKLSAHDTKINVNSYWCFIFTKWIPFFICLYAFFCCWSHCCCYKLNNVNYGCQGMYVRWAVINSRSTHENEDRKKRKIINKSKCVSVYFGCFCFHTKTSTSLETECR